MGFHSLQKPSPSTFLQSWPDYPAGNGGGESLGTLRHALLEAEVLTHCKTHWLFLWGLATVKVQIKETLCFPVWQKLSVCAKKDAVISTDIAQPDRKFRSLQHAAHLQGKKEIQRSIQILSSCNRGCCVIVIKKHLWGFLLPVYLCGDQIEGKILNQDLIINEFVFMNGVV